ncbi:hypothetical protein BCR36DRAFT_287005 [Piromyces finnis]|uniref:G-protein coupled receptors family 3 profile domain-containing protein n=1 Tax=Piromyces finnis TaxID=1754191 RepID=A0A1Y1VBL0_9FUNG|nr:hypothetical protein BCR36DRAFT_287005 [Piromyces finnis]|eukprot:ORX52136.1 hypothetical protein BCR36DRAFT_287005 [Piromyces finnis]
MYILLNSYEPKCEPSCYSGKCINNNVCDCSNTHFTGPLCNEYKQSKRMKIMDKAITILASLLIITSIVIIALLIHYKNDSIIKGGGLDFLIIIIIGSIINLIYALTLAVEKTIHKCYFIYLFKNTGFSLVFGSIFVKSLRIYRIFCQKRRMRLGLPREIMYAIVFLITIFHWLMAFFWTILHKISIRKGLTRNFEEYKACKYPLSMNLSTGFNLIVMFSGLMISYFIRNVDKKFKEVII